MKPWSCGGIAGVPPFASAFLISASTSARLSHDSATKASLCVAVLHTDFFVNVLKNGSPSSITNPSSLSTMHAALSSVNCGLNSNPSFEKNSMLRLRFLGDFCTSDAGCATGLVCHADALGRKICTTTCTVTASGDDCFPKLGTGGLPFSSYAEIFPLGRQLICAAGYCTWQ